MVPRRGEWETPFFFRLIYLTKSKMDSGCKQAAVAMLYGMSFLFSLQGSRVVVGRFVGGFRAARQRRHCHHVRMTCVWKFLFVRALPLLRARCSLGAFPVVGKARRAGRPLVVAAELLTGVFIFFRSPRVLARMLSHCLHAVSSYAVGRAVCLGRP